MKANTNFRNNLLSLKESGEWKECRPKYKDGTPAKTLSIGQVFEKYDLRKESVLHNYRPTAIKSAIQEMFWIYQDQTSDLDKAHERGIYWWDEFEVKSTNTIGSAYGGTIAGYKLINNLLNDLQYNPFSRRHILSMWQEAHVQRQIKLGGLVPCAYETIWSVSPNYEVDVTLIQRSGDYVTASSAINKIQYVALLGMICGHLRRETGINYQPRYFAHYTHDLHIYDRHLSAIDELLEREAVDDWQGFFLRGDKNFYDYTIDDFEIHKTKIEPIKNKLELAI